MIGRLLFIACLFVPLFAYAQSEEVHVVELASFECPNCYKLEQSTGVLGQMLGERFVFAPIPSDLSRNTVVRTYYALRDQVGSKRLRTLLFQLVQTYRMQPESIGQVAEFLRMNGIKIKPNELRRRVLAEEVEWAMNRALYLALDANLSGVPAMVVVKEGKIALAFEMKPNEAMSDLVQRVKKAIK